MKNYTDTQFLSAKEKAQIEKQFTSFMKFLASDAWAQHNENANGTDYGMEAPRVFTKKLYQHLSGHCGYIAHYNLHGFYDTYFSGGANKLQSFFGRMNGWAWGDYRDIGETMQEIANKYLPTIMNAADQRDSAREIRIATALAAKHGLKLV